MHCYKEDSNIMNTCTIFLSCTLLTALTLYCTETKLPTQKKSIHQKKNIYRCDYERTSSKLIFFISPWSLRKSTHSYSCKNNCIPLTITHTTGTWSTSNSSLQKQWSLFWWWIRFCRKTTTDISFRSSFWKIFMYTNFLQHNAII